VCPYHSALRRYPHDDSIYQLLDGQTFPPGNQNTSSCSITLKTLPHVSNLALAEHEEPLHFALLPPRRFGHSCRPQKQGQGSSSPTGSPSTSQAAVEQARRPPSEREKRQSPVKITNLFPRRVGRKNMWAHRDWLLPCLDRVAPVSRATEQATKQPPVGPTSRCTARMT